MEDLTSVGFQDGFIVAGGAMGGVGSSDFDVEFDGPAVVDAFLALGGSGDRGGQCDEQGVVGDLHEASGKLKVE